MAYEKTWQFDSNRSKTPALAVELTMYQMWYLANFLLGAIGGAVSGLWTYEGSSDGTTADMSANIANYKWGTPGTFDATKFVQITAAPASSAHSWIVLKSPVMPNGFHTYLLISAYATSTAGFGIHTSNSAWTLASTGTWQPINAAFVPASTTTQSQTTNDATTTNRYFNGALATDGSFMVWDAKQGSGFGQHAVIWQPTSNYQTGDNFAYYFNHAYNASNPGFGAYNNLSGAGTAINAARNGVNGTIGNNLIPEANMYVTGGVNKDLITSGIFDYPAHIFWTDSSTFCHARGRLADFGVTLTDSGPQYIPWGSTIKVAGVVNYITAGLWIFPYNTTPSL